MALACLRFRRFDGGGLGFNMVRALASQFGGRLPIFDSDTLGLRSCSLPKDCAPSSTEVERASTYRDRAKELLPRLRKRSETKNSKASSRLSDEY